MKRVLLLLTCFTIFAAFTKDAGKDVVGNSVGSSSAGIVMQTQVPKGKEMMSKLDCYVCHKDQEKGLVGPGYMDVAKKYPATPANIETLAQKIIKGGGGVWGQAQMSPHPTIALADAKEMVKYILSVKPLK